MKIKKLRVLNLNSFRDEVVLNFGNTNFFVGRNASGKSNLIMVLNKMLQAQTNQILNIPPFDRTYSKSSIAECWINFDEEDISKFVSSEPYSYITSSLPSLAPDVNSFSQGLEHFAKSSKVEIVSSWSKGKQSISRNFITDNKLDMPVYQQGRGLTQRENAVSNLFSQFHVLIHNHILSKSIFVSDSRDLSTTFPIDINPNQPVNPDSILTYVLRWMINDRATYDSLVKLTKRLLPNFRDLQIEPTGGNSSLEVREKGLSFPVPGVYLSKGSREILVILSALVLAEKSSCLFIEEPEIHLFPHAVKDLKNIILEVAKAKDLQIFISTHQPLMLDGLYPETDSNIKFFEFNNTAPNGSQVSEVSSDKEVSALQERLDVGS